MGAISDIHFTIELEASSRARQRRSFDALQAVLASTPKSGFGSKLTFLPSLSVLSPFPKAALLNVHHGWITDVARRD
jgi:hypothetical protein